MNQAGDNGAADERNPLIDATFVDGFDVDDDEEDRWMGSNNGVVHHRIHRTRANRLRRR